MIKATLKQIISSTGALGALANAMLPIKGAYRVSKLIGACNSELRQFEEMRTAEFTKAGCKLGEKNQWEHEDKDVLDKAVKEVKSALDMSVELNALPLDLEQFGNAEVPGGVFAELEWAMTP